MTTTYQVADMMIGVRNMIEAADLRRGDQVLLLADTRSDKTTLEALTAGLQKVSAQFELNKSAPQTVLNDQ